eukprot:TRINITY_DN46882_c0_g1_i1.p1 TRINITY_DN46882_c0_g1~~TRINITY_DN46882_c0_g1_i1.p1  ORF type:complete len:1269 (+),score=186.38 TRINITY_DN46882_c0_g1_i1:79-3885(+)
MKWRRGYLLSTTLRWIAWTLQVNGAYLCNWGLPSAEGEVEERGCRLNSKLHEAPFWLHVVWLVLSNGVVTACFLLGLQNWCIGKQTKLSNNLAGLGSSFSAMGIGFVMAFLGPVWGLVAFMMIVVNGYYRVASTVGMWIMPKRIMWNFGIRLLHMFDLVTDVATCALLDISTPEGLLYLGFAVTHMVSFTATHFCSMDAKSALRVAVHVFKVFIDLPLLALEIIVLATGAIDGSGAIAVVIMATLSTLTELISVVMTLAEARSDIKYQSQIESVVQLAEDVADRLASYDLGGARKLIAHCGVVASERLLLALRKQIDNLEQYRPFLPEHVLPDVESPYVKDELPEFDSACKADKRPSDSASVQTRQRSSTRSCQGGRDRAADALIMSDTPPSKQCSGSGQSRSGSGIDASPPQSHSSPGGIGAYQESPQAVVEEESAAVDEPEHDQMRSFTVGSVRNAVGLKNCLMRGQVTLMLARLQCQWADVDPLGSAALFVELVLRGVRGFDGVVVSLTTEGGDATVLTEWNVRRRYALHTRAAALASLAVRDALQQQSEAMSNPLLPGLPCSAAQEGIVQCNYALAVALGGAHMGIAGDERTLAPIIVGQAVHNVFRLARLAPQLHVKLVADGRVYQRASSDVVGRIVDVIPQFTGAAFGGLPRGRQGPSALLVYEIQGAAGTDVYGPPECYVDGFSRLRCGDYAGAAEKFSEAAKVNGDDFQVLRLLRISLFLASNPGDKDSYTREERSMWEDYECQAEQTPLPPSVLETVPTPTTSQQALIAREETDRGQSEVNNPGDDVVLQRQLDDLLQRIAQGEDLGQQELPAVVHDARGLVYHRSSLSLGAGCFGEVWLGMGADGGMVAVKSIALAGGADSKPASEQIFAEATDGAPGPPPPDLPRCSGYTEEDSVECMKGTVPSRGDQVLAPSVSDNSVVSAVRLAATPPHSPRANSRASPESGMCSPSPTQPRHGPGPGGLARSPTVAEAIQAMRSKRCASTVGDSENDSRYSGEEFHTFKGNFADLFSDRPGSYRLHARSQGNLKSAAARLQALRTQVPALVQEVRLMVPLRHENIVQFLGCGVVQGFVFIVMEYVPGGSIQQLMRRFDGVIPTPCVKRLVSDITQGLQFIHENGLIHRDLKPGNVLVTAEGQARLADFGAAGEFVAVVGDAVVGSPAYMAPEQVLGRAVKASDVWSLGIMVVEMYTGVLPYDREWFMLGAPGFLRNVVNKTFVPIIPQALPADGAVDFVKQCLCHDYRLRRSAQELACHHYLMS